MPITRNFKNMLNAAYGEYLQNHKGGKRMKPEKFNELVEEQIQRCRCTLVAKSNYGAEADRLHNFRAFAELSGESLEEVCGGYLGKHLVSIYDMIRKTGQGSRFLLPQWDEKIGDAINYLLILSAIVRESEEDEVPLNFEYSTDKPIGTRPVIEDFRDGIRCRFIMADLPPGFKNDNHTIRDLYQQISHVMFESSEDADSTLTLLRGIIRSCGHAMVSDFFRWAQVDYKGECYDLYGWTDLKTAYVAPGWGYWSLHLPQPKRLESKEKAAELQESCHIHDETAKRFYSEIQSVIFETPEEAKGAAEELEKLVLNEGQASVRDLFDLANMKTTPSYDRYGWKKLDDIKIKIDATHFSGVTLVLPVPEKLSR